MNQKGSVAVALLIGLVVVLGGALGYTVLMQQAAKSDAVVLPQGDSDIFKTQPVQKTYPASKNSSPPTTQENDDTNSGAFVGYDEQLGEPPAEPTQLVVASGEMYYASIAVPVKYAPHVQLSVTSGVFEPTPLPNSGEPQTITVNGSSWQMYGTGDAGCSAQKYYRVPPSDRSETVLVWISVCEGDGVSMPTQAEVLKILGSLSRG
ncbi:MAG: hypothetical protein AAB734_00400 [Patescibacteria group bacterium]